MGMAGTLARRWQQVNDRYLAASALASDVAGSYASVSRAMRMLLQSAMLGVGRLPGDRAGAQRRRDVRGRRS